MFYYPIATLIRKTHPNSRILTKFRHSFIIAHDLVFVISGFRRYSYILFGSGCRAVSNYLIQARCPGKQPCSFQFLFYFWRWPRPTGPCRFTVAHPSLSRWATSQTGAFHPASHHLFCSGPSTYLTTISASYASGTPNIRRSFPPPACHATAVGGGH